MSSFYRGLPGVASVPANRPCRHIRSCYAPAPAQRDRDGETGQGRLRLEDGQKGEDRMTLINWLLAATGFTGAMTLMFLVR